MCSEVLVRPLEHLIGCTVWILVRVTNIHSRILSSSEGGGELLSQISNFCLVSQSPYFHIILRYMTILI